MVSVVRTEMARLLGLPENRVRVKTAFLGGGFGAKTYIKVEAIAAACAMLTRLPVKIALSMEEQFYTINKHANTLRLKSAVTKDGRVTARECEIWWNGGAYADIGPRLTQKTGFTAAGPYDIENVHIDSYAVYTHLPPAAGLRGFGVPTLTFVYESHTDLIARALGVDPIDFRRRNLLREGRPQATGTIMKDAATEAVLERLAERMNWETPMERGEGTVRRGRGIGIGFKASISNTTSVAIVNVYGDGSCSVYCNTVDMGQGSDTAMAQIAGEVLDIPAENVRIVHPDTDVTPYDMGTLGSRSTFHMGQAVKCAAEEARDKLLTLAKELGVSPETTPIRRSVPPALRDAGGQRRRHRHLQSEIEPAGPFDRARREHHAQLDDRRHRRGSRSGYRDGARARDEARERRGLRHAVESEDRRVAAFGRGDDAAWLHDVRRHPASTRDRRRTRRSRITRSPASAMCRRSS